MRAFRKKDKEILGLLSEFVEKVNGINKAIREYPFKMYIGYFADEISFLDPKYIIFGKKDITVEMTLDSKWSLDGLYKRAQVGSAPKILSAYYGGKKSFSSEDCENIKKVSIDSAKKCCEFIEKMFNHYKKVYSASDINLARACSAVLDIEQGGDRQKWNKLENIVEFLNKEFFVCEQFRCIEARTKCKIPEESISLLAKYLKKPIRLEDSWVRYHDYPSGDQVASVNFKTLFFCKDGGKIERLGVDEKSVKQSLWEMGKSQLIEWEKTYGPITQRLLSLRQEFAEICEKVNKL
ncbi:MAG: hypothetical protein LBC95_01660 [Candidatus Nomurabacteria bacterium]|jgi:hypothetical protein|nr:hypothetical protein [Candidatus Nomurabacteria bacterium]